MHLVFIIDNPPIIGGGDYAMFKYAEHLARRGHRVDVFGLSRNEFLDGIGHVPGLHIRLRGELPPWFRGVGRINALWERVYTRLVVDPFLRRHAGNVDYIFGYLRRSAAKAARLGRRHGLRVANFVFESPRWLERQLGELFRRQYTGRYRRSWEEAEAAYRESAILFPLSELVRTEVAEWLGREVAPAIYPGVDAFGAPDDAGADRHILYIGRLDATKNVHEIIDAVAGLNDAPPLVIAGSGHDEAELRDRARQRGLNCAFTGRVSDEKKWALIRDAIFLVFPTSFEGFGIPPAEALAFGKPCICSDIPILREIYEDRVEYVPEHQVDELRDRMKQLLADADYRRRRGREGREFIAARYTWARAAERMESILEEHRRASVGKGAR